MAEPRPNPDPRFTYGDYALWPAGERWELMDGVPYDMTPAPNRLHQRIVTRLLTQIESFLSGQDGPCEVYPAPFDVRLPDNREADALVRNVVQPDISVICDPAKLDDAGCRGAPDFVIEVLSPSSIFHDTVYKTALYEKHGVREYWIVDPEAQTVTVRLRGESGHFGRPRTRELSGPPVAVSVLPGLLLDAALR